MDWSKLTVDCRLSTVLDALLTVVLAPSCAACGELLEHPSRGPVCARCWRSVLPLTPPLCDRCGDPLPAWRPITGPLPLCPRCRRSRPQVDHARSIGEYDGALGAIIHAVKYEGRRSLAVPLARLMRERGSDMLEDADFLVPVPLHRSRRRARGFNQAHDLARHLGPPVLLALRKVRATPTQTGLPAARRHRNVRNAFALTRAARRLAGSTVVLIDDVRTTGATLEACARTLKNAEVREVRALTAARCLSYDLAADGQRSTNGVTALETSSAIASGGLSPSSTSQSSSAANRR